MATKDPIYIPEFRVSFPNVFIPKKNDLSGKMEYSLVALFPKNAKLEKAIALYNETREAKFGKGKLPVGFKSPFRDQGEREKEMTDDKGKSVLVMPEGYEKGAVFMNLKTTVRPGLLDADCNKIIDAEAFYAGCYAIATVTCYAYDTKGNKGVAFGLQNIQKTRDGEPLSGRRKAEDEFQPIAGAIETDTSSIFAK